MNDTSNIEKLLDRLTEAWHNHDDQGRVFISMKDARELCENVLPSALSPAERGVVGRRKASDYVDGTYGPDDLAAIWNACCEAHRASTPRAAEAVGCPIQPSEHERVRIALTASLTKAAARRKSAEAQVRAKFPDLIEGSSGWYRAVANRMKRTP